MDETSGGFVVKLLSKGSVWLYTFVKIFFNRTYFVLQILKKNWTVLMDHVEKVHSALMHEWTQKTSSSKEILNDRVLKSFSSAITITIIIKLYLTIIILIFRFG